MTYSTTANTAAIFTTRKKVMNMRIAERKKAKNQKKAMSEIIYKMGMGLPRGEKIIVKMGARQADIWLDHEESAWRVKIDRDLPETTYPHLENAILSAQTLLREVT